MTLPFVQSHLCVPGDVVVMDPPQYSPCGLYVRGADDDKGRPNFTRVAVVPHESRGMVISVDKNLQYWLFVLIDSRIGWVTTDDIEVVERDGVQVMR